MRKFGILRLIGLAVVIRFVYQKVMGKGKGSV